MKPKRIAGLSGFGDAIYIEPIVRKIAENEEKIILYTDHKQIFEHIANVEFAPYSASIITDIKLSYLHGKSDESTTQLDDLGYEKADDFSIKSKKTALLCAGYKGMRTRDEFIPEHAAIQTVVNNLNHRGYITMQISNNAQVDYNLEQIYCANYYHTLMLFKAADLIVCQQGWATALAEGLNKRCLVIFARKIAESESAFIRQVTPHKVCCKSTTKFLWDSEIIEDKNSKLEEYLDALE